MTSPTKEQIKAAADRAEARSRGEAAKDYVETTVVLDTEIKRLAALSIGVYESSRIAEAKRLQLRATVLDMLVKAERDRATKGQKDFLPHWKVEPWRESVDGATLLTKLRNHFLRHVVLPKHADVVLALWTLHTWVFDCFDITPYLAITSPTRRCGKTLLMTMLYWLCCRAKKNDSMSKAATAITMKTPDDLNDRAFDAWKPLLAIAEHIGGDWPKLAREAAVALSGGENGSEERSVELLYDSKAEFEGRSTSAITTKTLIAALCSDEERPWATYNRGQRITDRQLAKLLKPFGIISETVQTSETGEPQAKGYRRAHFDDAFARYLTPAQNASPQPGGPQASKRTSADGMGTTSDFCVRPETDLDGCEKREKPANDGGLYAWTAENPLPPHEGKGSNGGGRSDVGHDTPRRPRLPMARRGLCALRPAGDRRAMGLQRRQGPAA